MPKHKFTLLQLNLNPSLQIPFNSITHNYSILPNSSFNIVTNHISKVTPCSIAACKSIGGVATNNVYCVLFNSGSSKTWIHKHFVPCNYTHIQSDNYLYIFSHAKTTISTDLVALENMIPSIQLQHDCHWTPCTHCWRHESST